ncbi:LysR family transcriptional regulator [Paenibacillus albicereus]|uniref:LysR family transcriptional regulator n=1 Tax=Paenibacillus albicereus TaxID=2726185 RepID=A0A6H2GT04_9BACL|nr:LysR family transcriptional regulator [Paenibacillus albicereus]QJC50278.1 LysR family transcriptional regulator [Paenibacillus albicereus]
MDLRHLSYLLEIAKQQNMTKAAQTLHLSQPTLSKIVRSVEDELGAPVFDRSGKGLRLTDSGAAAIRQIPAVLRAVQDLHTAMDDVAELKTGTIAIGLPPVIGSVFFPRVISPFQREFPNVSFQVTEEGAKRIEGLLLSGELDIGVVVGPVNAQSFHAVPFIRQQLALIVHEAHPLAGRRRASIAELADEPFILFSYGFAVRQLVLRACQAAGYEPRILHSSSQWDLMAEMVAAGVGISILPDVICSKITDPRIRVIQLDDPVIPWELDVIWPRDNYVPHAVRSFIKFIRLSEGMTD